VPINDRPIPVEEYRELQNKLTRANNAIESLNKDKESVLECLKVEKTKVNPLAIQVKELQDQLDDLQNKQSKAKES
jgi:chromosome segregation ATPase